MKNDQKTMTLFIRRQRETSGWQWHTDWIKSLIIVSLAAAITNCGKPSVVGLRGEYPPVIRKSFSLHTEFVEVESLTPVFRWHPLMIPHDHQSIKPGSEGANNITYELRVWRTVAVDGTKVVYVRDRLTATEHQIEKPLEPGTRYYWSIRAHFEIDDRHRATEWALAGYPLRHESVPNESCLRFKTPLEVKGKN